MKAISFQTQGVIHLFNLLLNIFHNELNKHLFLGKQGRRNSPQHSESSLPNDNYIL